MYDMFYNCSNLTDISALANWNTSSVTNMQGMFYQCSNLTDISALVNWNTSSVITMVNMFYNTKISDISPLSSWNVSAVTNMTSLFSTCSNLTSLSFQFQLILFQLQLCYRCFIVVLI